MPDIAANLLMLRRRIAEYEHRYERTPGSVALLAVSKTHGQDKLRIAIDNGQTMFGESYAQEALKKIAVLNDERINWHFIGPVQSNKTRAIAENFAWVHSVDRMKIARRLDEAVPDTNPPLNICIQVNISGESTKAGIPSHEIQEFAAGISRLKRLQLRGLMAMPALVDDIASQRRAFRSLRESFEQLRQQLPALDTLSMGTTDDLEAAIAEGSTIVRVGTAVFGERE